MFLPRAVSTIRGSAEPLHSSRKRTGCRPFASNTYLVVLVLHSLCDMRIRVHRPLIPWYDYHFPSAHIAASTTLNLEPVLFSARGDGCACHDTKLESTDRYELPVVITLSIFLLSRPLRKYITILISRASDRALDVCSHLNSVRRQRSSFSSRHQATARPRGFAQLCDCRCKKSRALIN